MVDEKVNTSLVMPQGIDTYNDGGAEQNLFNRSRYEAKRPEPETLVMEPVIKL